MAHAVGNTTVLAADLAQQAGTSAREVDAAVTRGRTKLARWLYLIARVSGDVTGCPHCGRSPCAPLLCSEGAREVARAREHMRDVLLVVPSMDAPRWRVVITQAEGDRVLRQILEELDT